jgi:hypothetical protein
VICQLGEQLIVQFQLVRPRGFVEASNGVELLFREIQACPVEFLVSRADAERLIHACCFAFNPVYHPCQHAHVFTVAWPDEFAGSVFAEPIGAEDFRLLNTSFFARCFDFFADIEPMLEIVAHVVASVAARAVHGAALPVTDGLELSHVELSYFRYLIAV